MEIFISKDNCTGCKKCTKACPYGALVLIDGKAAVNDRCTACGACLTVCKTRAIISNVKEREIPAFDDRKGVWVFVEQTEGHIHKVTLELLGIGQILAASTGQELSAVLLGNNVYHCLDTLKEFGAKNVYFCQHPGLENYQTASYSKIISEIVQNNKPNILLIGATPIGRDLAPRLAIRLEVGLTADCTELAIDQRDGTLLQTRPAFGGNVMATIKSPYSRPQMATVRPGVMKATRTMGSYELNVIEKKAHLSPQDTPIDVLERINQKGKNIGLENAKVIVAAGRGAASEKGIKFVFALAEALGGEVACTRPLVEEGLLPLERQVGQTGLVVKPEIYIACGISGAIQHKAGMSDSRYIIAINSDKNAPIFGVADWGILGDLNEVVPTFAAAITRRAERREK
jgi:electron transfer flavoprotein alpha subunit